ncbi:hypothetical protein BGX38DRAFT_1267895 [Terfezia claveryi]|nr:hypothetical protein BGX38DRAFT_1267895 [Terfezia claveryi]
MSTQLDDGASLLSESTYEILSESTLLLTDDEDEGSSVNSFDDDYSIEDVNYIGDTDSDSLQDYPSESRDHPGIPSFGGLDEFHMENSANTLKEEPASINQIEFEEPPPRKSGLVSVVHALKEYSTEEATTILSAIRSENLSDRLLCTLRQTMSQELLCLDEPFRFLYVGSQSAKEEIFNKLGAALALPVVECASSTISSDSGSSRFNVVPVTSFGMKSSPEVELIESFGVEMSIDICNQAGRMKVDGRPDTLSLCLNGNQWVRSTHGDDGFRLEAANWRLPHLAVIFCTEEDTLEEKLARVYTRSFVERHSVPTLVISQKPLFKLTENHNLDIRCIHMCLESRGGKSGDHLYKRLPVDLATFNSLDVRQMNRNLACITGLVKNVDRGSATNLNGCARKNTSLLSDVEKTPNLANGLTSSIQWLRNNKPRDTLMLAAISWLFICGIVGGLFATASMKYFKTTGDVPANASMNIVSTVISQAVPSSTMTSARLSTSTSASLSKPSSTSVRSRPTSCGYSEGIARSLLLEPTPLAANDSQEFKVHIIGKNNIILRPPQHHTTARKPPQMFVEVTRNGEAISSELSKLFDGVYTVVIPHDDAWGLMNVSVQTKSKPLMKETFELDFGMPWFKLTGWKKMAVQQKEEMVKMAEQASSEGKRIAGEINQKTAQLRHQTQKLLETKATQLSDNVSKQMSKLYSMPNSLRSVRHWSEAASLDYIKRAQRQAVNVWSKVELGRRSVTTCGNESDCGQKPR